MTVGLDELLKAADNPSDAGPPKMLSVGDSVMWGQGLRPEDKFRELVRQRLSRDHGRPITELSMARSGAHLTSKFSDEDVASGDTEIEREFRNDQIPAHYDPDNFAREVPNASPTTEKQLKLAHRVLEDDDGADPDDIELILLDGGANDVGIFGFILPIKAYRESGSRGWSAWLTDRAEEVEEEMRDTLEVALERFPNAAVVVTGYYAVFSYESALHTLTPHQLSALHAALDVLLPLSIDTLASGSAAWQAVSNEHVRRAVADAGSGDRTVAFARSDIEGVHSIFAPDSWLWEFGHLPENDLPPEAVLGAVAEDDVRAERRAICESEDIDGGPTCRLASVGHPNVVGARDYAAAIDHVLEAEGVVEPTGHRCERVAARNRNACDRASDDGTYRCVQADAAIGETCGPAVDDLGSSADEQFDRADDSFNDAGEDFDEAGDCYDDLDEATDECESERERAIEECEERYRRRRDDCEDIQCTSYTNCDRFAWYDPRRGACKAAREACKASASVRREGCKAAAFAERETCKAAATVKDATCRVGAVAERTACAAKESGEALADVATGIAHGVAGAALAVAAFVTFTACTVVRWGVNRVCRAVVAIGTGVCSIGAGVAEVACWFGSAAGVPVREAVGELERERTPSVERELREPVTVDGGDRVETAGGRATPADGRAAAPDGPSAGESRGGVAADADGPCYRCLAGGLLTLALVGAAVVSAVKRLADR
jgi:hypothetical protein